MSSTPSVQLLGNSVRPILFVFERSTDHHVSLNAGWFVQGRQSPERKRHRNVAWIVCNCIMHHSCVNLCVRTSAITPTHPQITAAFAWAPLIPPSPDVRNYIQHTLYSNRFDMYLSFHFWLVQLIVEWLKGRRGDQKVPGSIPETIPTFGLIALNKWQRPCTPVQQAV